MITRNNEESVVFNRGFTDAIKFFAACMVAFGHYAGHAMTFSESIIYRITVLFAGSLGVALFFFLSGYGLMMSELKHPLAFGPFMKKRLARVYLPVVLVSFVWQIVLWPKGAGIERIPHFLYAVFWGFSDGILWFVKAIVICYLLFRLFLVSRNWGNAVSILCLVLTSMIAYVLVHYLFADWAAISTPLFFLGIFVAMYNKLCYRIIHSWQVILVVSGLTVISVLLYLWKGNLFIHAYCNWIVIIGVLVLCSYYKVVMNSPSWMGDVSYDIYITHNKVLNYLKPIYEYIGLSHFLIGTLIATVASFSLRKSLFQ